MKYAFLLTIPVFFFISCGNQPAEKQEELNETSSENTAAWNSDEPSDEMFADFLLFRKAVLNGSCEDLAAICEFPLKGVCAAYLLNPSEDYDPERVVTKEQLLAKCNLLEEAELAVLKKRTSVKAETAFKNDDCEFQDRFTVEKDGTEFSWEIGCLHVLSDNEEIGEYGHIFVFRKIGGRFKLYKIDCVG